MLARDASEKTDTPTEAGTTWDEGFYLRANNITRQLGIAEAHEYVSTRWSS